METDDRRTELIEAATDLFEEKGVANTTIADVTERVGVARSLFYHYFDNKDDLIDAVVDSHVTDFLSHIDRWLRDDTNKDTYGKVALVVGLLRSYFTGDNSYGYALHNEGNDQVLQLFAVRSAQRLADAFASTPNEHRRTSFTIGVRHPREAYYLLGVGLISLLRRRPDTPDEVLVGLILDMLQIRDI